MKKLSYLIESGDLVVVTEQFPDWDWLEYTTNDIGVVTKIRDYNFGFLILDIYFFRNKIQTTIPEYFVKQLSDDL